MDTADGTPRTAERRTSDETRSAMRVAAAALFAERGFTATSVRDIAKEAGADAALVIRYFGSKERLFLETMTVENILDGIGDGPLGRLGVDVLRRLLPGVEQGRRVYSALMRAAERPEVRDYLVRATETQLVEPIAARLSGDDARFRAALIAAQVNGLLNALWILEEPSLVSMPIERVIEQYGAALQRLVDGASD